MRSWLRSSCCYCYYTKSTSSLTVMRQLEQKHGSMACKEKLMQYGTRYSTNNQQHCLKLYSSLISSLICASRNSESNNHLPTRSPGQTVRGAAPTALNAAIRPSLIHRSPGAAPLVRSEVEWSRADTNLRLLGLLMEAKLSCNRSCLGVAHRVVDLPSALLIYFEVGPHQPRYSYAFPLDMAAMEIIDGLSVLACWT